MSFEPPTCALVVYHQERDGIPLLSAVAENCLKSAAAENQGAGAYSIWAKGCMFDNISRVI